MCVREKWFVPLSQNLLFSAIIWLILLAALRKIELSGAGVNAWCSKRAILRRPLGIGAGPLYVCIQFLFKLKGNDDMTKMIFI